MKKIKEFFADMTETVSVTKLDGTLIVAIAALSGVIIGKVPFFFFEIMLLATPWMGFFFYFKDGSYYQGNFAWFGYVYIGYYFFMNLLLIFLGRARSTDARPMSSSNVSPFMRIAVKNAAICACVASPLNMISIAFFASSCVKFFPSTAFAMYSFMIILLVLRSKMHAMFFYSICLLQEQCPACCA